MLKKDYLWDPERKTERTVRIWIIVTSALSMAILLVAAISRPMSIDTDISHDRPGPTTLTRLTAEMRPADLLAHTHLRDIVIPVGLSTADRNAGSGPDYCPPSE